VEQFLGNYWHVVLSVREKAQRILYEHHPQELPPDTTETVSRMMKNFESRF